MILKTSKFIFIWFGRTSTATERLNAYNFAARMKKASNRPLEISTIDDGYEQSINDICKKDWNQYLCLSQRSVHPTDVIPVPSETVFRLYKCGFTNNKYRIEEIKSKALMQSDLDDNAHAFIIDGGLAFGVWIWVGRYTELKDKAEAMRNCRGFVKKVISANRLKLADPESKKNHHTFCCNILLVSCFPFVEELPIQHGSGASY